MSPYTPPSTKSTIARGLARAAKPKLTGSQTTPEYKAGLTAAFQKLKDGMPAAAAPQTAPATPRVDPFYNPQQQMDLAGFNYDQATNAQGIDDQLAQLRTQTTYQQSQLDDQAKKGTSATNDDAAARGIFQSSIKEGGLADIEAQKTIQKGYLTNQLSNAQIRGDAAKEALRIRGVEFMKGMDNQAVANADAINSQIQPEAPAPAPAPAAPAAPAAPQIDPSKWVSTTYTNVNGHQVHVFADGHKEVQVNGVWKRV